MENLSTILYLIYKSIYKLSFTICINNEIVQNNHSLAIYYWVSFKKIPLII